MEGIFKLVLQQLVMLVGVQFVKVNVNDLYAWPEKRTVAAATAGGKIKARAPAPG